MEGALGTAFGIFVQATQYRKNVYIRACAKFIQTSMFQQLAHRAGAQGGHLIASGGASASGARHADS
jgi:hypothetical protein